MEFGLAGTRYRPVTVEKTGGDRPAADFANFADPNFMVYQCTRISQIELRKTPLRAC